MDLHIEALPLGTFLYLAMGECDGHKVIMGVGYTPEYANKKAIQFESKMGGKIVYKDISVIRTGEKMKCNTLDRF
jgi:hypothetical protein